MPDPIAITGATGALGGRVARALAARGVSPRLVVRDPARAPQLDGAEIREAAGYDDVAGMTRALEGAGTLYLVSAAEHPDRVRLHAGAIDAAVDAGVERIVYVSFLAAAPDATFTFARDHWHTEQHIAESSLRHTFLRNSLFADFLSRMAGPDGVIRGPAAHGRVAPVSRDDSAQVAVAVLLGEGHDGATYDVTGPRAQTLTELAAEMAAVTGRPYRYQPETLEEAYASRAHYDAEPYEVAGWVTTYAAIATGEMDVVSDTVPRLTGHPAQTVAEHLRQAAAAG